jgi:hypothetical protein
MELLSEGFFKILRLREVIGEKPSELPVLLFFAFYRNPCFLGICATKLRNGLFENRSDKSSISILAVI